MTEFAYNNTQNKSISHIPFESNYKNYVEMFYEENIVFYYKLNSVNK